MALVQRIFFSLGHPTLDLCEPGEQLPLLVSSRSSRRGRPTPIVYVNPNPAPSAPAPYTSVYVLSKNPIFHFLFSVRLVPPPMKTFFWRLSPCIPSGRPMMGRESIPWTGLAKPLDPEGPPPAQATLDPGLVRARSQPIGLRTMLSLHYCQIWDGHDYKDIWPNGCEGAGF